MYDLLLLGYLFSVFDFLISEDGDGVRMFVYLGQEESFYVVVAFSGRAEGEQEKEEEDAGEEKVVSVGYGGRELGLCKCYRLVRVEDALSDVSRDAELLSSFGLGFGCLKFFLF